MISDINLDSPLGKSDHSVIIFQFNAYISANNAPKTRYKYDKGDYNSMKDFLNINWDEYLGNEDIDTQWLLFCDKLQTGSEMYIPKVTVSNGNKTKKRHNLPISIKTKAKIKRKQRLWNKYLETGDERCKLQYNRVRNQIRRLTRQTIKTHEKNIADCVKDNPKKFWSYAQSKSKTKSSIPDLYKDDNKKDVTESDKEKADVLADFFTSVFTKDTDSEMPDIVPKVVPELNNIVINPSIVKKKLDSLKINKSPGPDKLHPRLLKELSEVLSYPLSLIFKKSVDTGKIPCEWKYANITALYKKGDKKYAGNYRPVSLTSVVCKVLESIIRENIVEHMKLNKLFSDKQFGFISGRSTVLQLIRVIDNWTEILDEGGCIDVAYCDFMKAFDKVCHKRLVHKLKLYNIGTMYSKWIESFLDSRKQKVIVNGVASSPKDVTSGIPQGSVLGPILFVLYINDLPDVIKNGSIPYLFADDTKIFHSIKCTQDCKDLQEDIKAMQVWSEKWLLCFHPDKCKCMRIGNTDIDLFTYKLKDSDKGMEFTKSEKDIGVVIDSKLSFENHINEKVNKANSIMGVIRRTFEFLDIKTFKILYTALVRPHVEYANQVWNPHLKKHIDLLENVQRRATKSVPGLSKLTYEERLRKIGLPTLAYRRIRGDMIETYKILSQKYDPEVSNFIKLREDSCTRGHKYKIFKNRSRLDVRKYSFCMRVVDSWNQLPPSVVEAETVNAFERRLDRHWKLQPIYYSYREAIIPTGQDPKIPKKKELELTQQVEPDLLSEEDL